MRRDQCLFKTPIGQNSRPERQVGPPLSAQLHIDVLGVGELQQFRKARLAANAGLLHSAKRCTHEVLAGVVDPQVAGENAFGGAVHGI